MTELETEPPSRTDAPQFLQREQRLHPMTLLQRLMVTLPGLILLLVPLLGGRDPRGWIYIVMLIAYGLVAMPLMLVHYWRFRFRLTPRELRIDSGVWTRRHRSIPIERIQNIEIERPVLARLTGTAKVRVETAGSVGAEGVLELVSLDTAYQIRDAIRALQRALNREGAVEAIEVGAEPAGILDLGESRRPRAESAPVDAYDMGLGRVMLSGVFRFSLVYIALMFSALEYLGVEVVEVFEWFERGRLRPVAEFARSSPWVTVLASMLVAAAFAWLTGIIVNLNRYFRFRLQIDSGKLYKHHGLLTVSEGAIPLRRIQALVLHTNPLMRRLDWWHLSVQTLGVESSRRGRSIIVPFARLREILDICSAFEPVSLPDRYQPVSRLTIRRRFVRYALVLLLGASVVSRIWPVAAWAAVVMPLLLVVAILQYRNHGYSLTDRHLFVRSGVFHHQVWVIPRPKFQAFFESATIFQRRLRLHSLYVDTAGAPTIRYPGIVDLPESESEERFAELTGVSTDGDDISSRS